MDGRIVNLSTHGFMVHIDGEFEQGEQILMDLPVVGETMAKVAWALGGRIGGQFVIPIQPGRTSWKRIKSRRTFSAASMGKTNEALPESSRLIRMPMTSPLEFSSGAPPSPRCTEILARKWVVPK